LVPFLLQKLKTNARHMLRNAIAYGDKGHGQKKGEEKKIALGIVIKIKNISTQTETNQKKLNTR